MEWCSSCNDRTAGYRRGVRRTTSGCNIVSGSQVYRWQTFSEVLPSERKEV